MSQQKEDAAAEAAVGNAATGGVSGTGAGTSGPALTDAAGRSTAGTWPMGSGRAPGPAPRRLWARPWVREVLVVAAFLAVGVAATWPRAAFLTGRLPATDDQAEYVWNMWWIAHQLTHLGNPWFTSYLAAPVGVRLGFDTLTPLLGLLMAPVTLLFGPSLAYGLLVIVMPGLACYAMYRVARLWLPGQVGPVAAGAFFGLSGMVAFQAWVHLHTAAGVVFLPLTMEVAVRLRRGATIGRGVALGVVLGAAMLVDQEFAVLAVILAALVLVPWLFGHHGRAQLRALAAGALAALVIAGPQLAAMAQQVAAGGNRVPTASDYIRYALRLPALFAPSPRLAHYGAPGLRTIYGWHATGDGLATFGVVLSLLAVLGLVVSWRRRSARLLGLLWLGSAALALGPALYLGGHQYVPLATHWRGLPVSLLMPDTWLLHLPVMSSFREPERLALLGVVGAALLAGAAVEWLRQHAKPALIAVVAFGALEAGWPGVPHPATMPTSLAAVDRPIAADHSGSLVVDVPFGIIGIPAGFGDHPSPLSLVLATADGHPRAVSYTSWSVPQTLSGIRRHAFYDGLVTARLGETVTPALLAAARQDARGLHVGWVLVWQPRWMNKGRASSHDRPHYHYPAIYSYLRQTGFHFAYQADGVVVYRP